MRQTLAAAQSHAEELLGRTLTPGEATDFKIQFAAEQKELDAQDITGRIVLTVQHTKRRELTGREKLTIAEGVRVALGLPRQYIDTITDLFNSSIAAASAFRDAQLKQVTSSPNAKVLK